MANKRFDNNTDIAASFSLPGVEVYPNNRFGDIARKQGLETARNWRRVKEGTTKGINDFAGNITDGAVTAISFSPFGGAVDAASIYNDLSNKNYASAGATAALALLPWGRIVRKGGSALRRQALKLPGYEEFERKAIEAAEKYGKNTWDNLQPYLYENPETKRRFDEAVENVRKTKEEYLSSKNAYDKADDIKYEYAKKEREALRDINIAKQEEEKLRKGKLSMTDTWGFPYKGNPFRANRRIEQIPDFFRNSSIKDIYKDFGITAFDPNDRRFINEMVKNGWDINKIDFSKFSNKELRSLGIDRKKTGKFNPNESMDIKLRVSTNVNNFNSTETVKNTIELSPLDPTKVSNEEFMKIYEKRVKNGKILELDPDGKIKINTDINGETSGKNIYSDLNTGVNEIWDILGGKMHRFEITAPKPGGMKISVNTKFDTKDLKPYADGSGSVGELLKIKKTNYGGDEYFTPVVDKDYVRILNQNIEEIKKRLPGFKEFGSSVSASRMGLPHATDDIDGFMTLNDLEKLMGGKESLKSMPVKRYARDGSGRVLTYKYNMDVGTNDKMPIDINVVDEPENLIELVRQTRPGDYYKWMQNKAKNVESGTRTFNTMPLEGYNPKEILEGMDPESKTIADMFEIDFANGDNGSKLKHKMRPIVMIANGNPEKVAKGMDTWAKGNFGPDIKQAPDMSGQFTDVERNKKMLQQMGYDYEGAEADIAKDPKKMQNAFNYWYLSTTVRGRGVDPTGKTPIYTMMTDWDPESIGGNANGAGLNTVTMGNSGHGMIYGYIQPNLGSHMLKTPEDIIADTNRRMGTYNYKLTKEEADKINSIIDVNIKEGRKSYVKEGDKPEAILNSIPAKGNEADSVMDEIDNQLGIRAITRNYNYGNEKYTSMTGEIRPDEVVAINYPKTASLYARKQYVPSIDDEEIDIALNKAKYNLRENLNDMVVHIGKRPDYLPIRRSPNYQYSQFDNTREGSFLDRALSRKSRFAEDAHRKTKEEYEEARKNANEAYRRYVTNDKKWEDAKNIFSDEKVKFDNQRWKYNQGTKYIDYGVKSGFGLYGLSNLYDYMVDKAEQDREQDKNKSN